MNYFFRSTIFSGFNQSLITKAFMTRVNKMDMSSRIGACHIEKFKRRISMFHSQLYEASSGEIKFNKNNKNQIIS